MRPGREFLALEAAKNAVSKHASPEARECLRQAEGCLRFPAAETAAVTNYLAKRLATNLTDSLADRSALAAAKAAFAIVQRAHGKHMTNESLQHVYRLCEARP